MKTKSQKKRSSRAAAQRNSRHKASMSRRQKRSQTKRWEGKPVPHVPKVIEAKANLQGTVK